MRAIKNRIKDGVGGINLTVRDGPEEGDMIITELVIGINDEDGLPMDHLQLRQDFQLSDLPYNALLHLEDFFDAIRGDQAHKHKIKPRKEKGRRTG